LYAKVAEYVFNPLIWLRTVLRSLLKANSAKFGCSQIFIVKKIMLLFSFLFSEIISSHATTWHVGAAQLYTAPSEVSSLVLDGDTVAIDAGTYDSDVAYWAANNLFLKGVGGFAHLNANGQSYGGKAIWVIGGNNTTIDSIEFSGCTVADHNGAGIRQEGVNLTVRDCYFHDNEEGILAGDNASSDILIEYTEFYNNGYGDGYSHNLYINHVHSLTFQYNYSHHAIIGHEVKSRAFNNYILYNRITNEETGTASREIDLPNGGHTIILGNEIEQGPQSTNSNIIGYGLEGLTNPESQLFVVNNTIVNDKSNGSFLDVEDGASLCKAYNNIFAGAGTILTGTPLSLDSSHNLYSTVNTAGFVDAANYDYQLLSSSPAIDNGTNPGFDSTFSLTPIHEYVHPLAMMNRIENDSLDNGAHEFGNPSNVFVPEKEPFALFIFPNPVTSSVILKPKGVLPENSALIIYKLPGYVVKNILVEGRNEILISVERLPDGIYFWKLVGANRKVLAEGKFVKQ